MQRALVEHGDESLQSCRILNPVKCRGNYLAREEGAERGNEFRSDQDTILRISIFEGLPSFVDPFESSRHIASGEDTLTSAIEHHSHESDPC